MSLSLSLSLSLSSSSGTIHPVYKLGEGYLNMETFLDANIDKMDIFVFQNLNEDDPTWKDS